MLVFLSWWKNICLRVPISYIFSRDLLLCRLNMFFLCLQKQLKATLSCDVCTSKLKWVKCENRWCVEKRSSAFLLSFWQLHSEEKQGRMLAILLLWFSTFSAGMFVFYLFFTFPTYKANLMLDIQLGSFLFVELVIFNH